MEFPLNEPLVLKVAARYQRQAALSEEKLKEILLKIRKGATSNLTWSQLSQVFDVLDPGWKLEKIVGLVKLYGVDGHEESPAFLFGTREEMEPRHNDYSKFAVQTLPTNPKAGQLYILEMSSLEPYQGTGKQGGDVKFTFKPWIGHEGWKVTSPQGEVFNGLPGKYSLDGSAFHGWKAFPRTKMPTGDVVRWLLKNTDWMDQINRKLNMDPHEPAVPRTRENTGSCPVCFQNIKLTANKMVLHGYRRPGTGSTHGSCFGVGYESYELSDDGMKDYLSKSLIPMLKGAQDYVRRLHAGEVNKINVASPMSQPRYVTKEDPNWDRVLKRETESAEKNVEYRQSDVGVYQRLVQHWKKRDLPKEGEPHIDWYIQGQKP